MFSQLAYPRGHFISFSYAQGTLQGTSSVFLVQRLPQKAHHLIIIHIGYPGGHFIIFPYIQGTLEGHFIIFSYTQGVPDLIFLHIGCTRGLLFFSYTQGNLIPDLIFIYIGYSTGHFISSSLYKGHFILILYTQGTLKGTFFHFHTHRAIDYIFWHVRYPTGQLVNSRWHVMLFSYTQGALDGILS